MHTHGSKNIENVIYVFKPGNKNKILRLKKYNKEIKCVIQWIRHLTFSTLSSSLIK